MKWLKRTGLAIGLVAVIVAAQFLPIKQDIVQHLPQFAQQIVQTVQKNLYTIGIVGVAYATTPDYVVDGTADDVQAQAALDALPSTGGEIVFYGGDYNFAATVTRAINNVTILGSGKSTYFVFNGSSAVFSAGSQTGWQFSNFRTDAGYLTLASDTIVDTVWNNSTLVLVPSGRGATYTVAGYDAPTIVKAQADYLCDNSSDQVQINAAFTAIRGLSGGNGSVRLIGSFSVNDTINATGFTGGVIAHPWSLDMEGASIIANINNKPILDMTGSLWGNILGGRITTTGSTPNVGILLARTSSNDSAGHHTFIGTSIYGSFSKAGLYNYGSEENEYLSLNISNLDAAGTVMTLTATNIDSVTSAFQTIATGEQSTYTNHMYGGGLQSVGGTALKIRSSATSAWMGHTFRDVMLFSSGTYAVYLDVTSENITGLVFDGCRVTDLVPTYAFYVNNAGVSRKVARVIITGCVLQANTNILKIDTNSTADNWIFDRSNLRIGGTGDNGTFTNSDIYTS